MTGQLGWLKILKTKIYARSHAAAVKAADQLPNEHPLNRRMANLFWFVTAGFHHSASIFESRSKETIEKKKAVKVSFNDNKWDKLLPKDQ